MFESVPFRILSCHTVFSAYSTVWTGVGFGFHNVTLDAVNVSCGVLSATHCSDNCLMWKAKLYAIYWIASLSSPYLRLDQFAEM